MTRHSLRNSTTITWESIRNSANQNLAKAKPKLISRFIIMRVRWRTQPRHGLRRIKIRSIQQCTKILANSILAELYLSLSLFRAGLFGKSKNVMLSHLFADAIEEEGASAKGGGGKKKGGGSMQTISATHRVRPRYSFRAWHRTERDRRILILRYRGHVFLADSEASYRKSMIHFRSN